ncbi:MAG: hypothetical protein MUC59_17765, partial [Saprospiraceae bacterium]|nr:hypothetical protein [Saprospiraceae bacterium]
MKLLISLFCLIPFLALSQQTAFFETTLYFEDALGNTDSVVVGNDPDAETGQMNTQFGEVDISAMPLSNLVFLLDVSG